MSADPDGDSRMASSTFEDSDAERSTATTKPHTPLPRTAQATTLSPPSSQGRGNISSSSSGMAVANENGKRPINTISNGNEDEVEVQDLTAGTGQGKPALEFPPKVHQPSGYTWSRAEDEPGYSWLSKKAMDEHHRAVDGLAHQHCVQTIKATYGDPFEAVDRETAILNSLQQR